MNQLFYGILLILFIVSDCHQEAIVTGEVVRPDFKTSKQDFVNSFSEVDSVSVSNSYSMKSGIFASSESNLLHVNFFFGTDQSSDDDQYQNAMDQFTTRAKKDITNLSDFDIIQINIFNFDKIVNSHKVSFRSM